MQRDDREGQGSRGVPSGWDEARLQDWGNTGLPEWELPEDWANAKFPEWDTAKIMEDWAAIEFPEWDNARFPDWGTAMPEEWNTTRKVEFSGPVKKS